MSNVFKYLLYISVRFCNQIINIDFQIGAGIETLAPLLKKDVKLSSIPLSEFTGKTKGLYLFVNSFHQLDPKNAYDTLKNIAENENPVVLVEGNNNSLWQIVGMTIFVPISVLIMTPFIQPFRMTRFIFTYLIPILPLFIMIDGCLALIKLYSPNDLNELVSNINVPNYKWQLGKKANGRGGKIIYLKGWKI